MQSIGGELKGEVRDSQQLPELDGNTGAGVETLRPFSSTRRSALSSGLFLLLFLLTELLFSLVLRDPAFSLLAPLKLWPE
jgi:hypothetical protein